MKKTIYLLTVILCISACNTEVAVEVTNDKESKIFEKNCETVRSYEAAFCQENIDYEKFYSDNAIIKGTTLGSKDSMNVADRKAAHQEMWQKYDFSISQPLNLLPGVNPETKKMDGSVRMYFNLTIILTENENSITIPIYESYDFDDEGKILFLQYYGDLTSAILSLEE
tara:strand:+ start:256 stop:762 length:507 start_codon:yes stop_codon:yes gene_type:complete